MGGKSTFFDHEEFQFPKPLIEIDGKPMIQHVIENFNSIKQEKKFIFIVNKEDCIKYHLDNILRLLTDDNAEIIIQNNNKTQGAVCSSLLAIEHINNDQKLIISNADQIIDYDLNEVMDFFAKENYDAGVVSFPSVHPKWSYVRLDENRYILETTEKKPISKNAIAGFYFYKHGKYFVRSSMKSIEKDVNVNGLYYIAPSLNELILENLHLGIYGIDAKQYKSFYSPQKIKEYESELQR
jgi:NDP-sugar pyrophosphorylase family protein